MTQKQSEKAKPSKDFIRQMQGYSLTTAQIFYRMPDYHSLMQEYLWQDYDMFPDFPVLKKFLTFWQEKLEGPLHSIYVAHTKLIQPAELKMLDGEFVLN